MNKAKYKKVSLNYLSKIVKKSKSLGEVLKRLGYSGHGNSFRYLKEYLIEQKINTDHFGRDNSKNMFKFSFEQMFQKNSFTSTNTIKRYIKKHNLIKYVCSECDGKDVWNNKKLVLVLDHINGIHTDNRLENLRFLCPNCNSQTETFSNKNTHRYSSKKYVSQQSKKEKIIKQKNQNDFKQIKQLLKLTKSIKETAKQLNLSVSGLVRKCQKYGIEFKQYQSYTLDYTKILSTDQKDLEKLLEKHRNLSAVGKIIGISSNAVKKRCHKYNIDYKKYFLLEDKVDEIYQFYIKEKHLAKTAKYFKISTFNLYRMFKKYNYPLLKNKKIITVE